jgi:hypothetical protein
MESNIEFESAGKVECAEISTDEGLVLVEARDHYEVKGYLGADSELVIPSEWDGKPVTVIREGAFEGCESIVSVVVPRGITKIGKGAFAGCENIENMTLPFVGESYYGADNWHFGYIFGAEEYFEHSDFVSPALRSVTLTGGAVIGEYAFYECTGLEEITMTEDIFEIGRWAFCECYLLRNVRMPAGLLRVDEGAFDGCNAIAYVAISDILDWLNIRFEDGAANPLRYGRSLYIGNEWLNEIVIPEGVTEIREYAFAGGEDIHVVTLPSTLRKIGAHSFAGCGFIKKIIIPRSVEEIGAGAFEGCDWLNISAEVDEAPCGWDEGWNPDNRPVEWGVH